MLMRPETHNGGDVYLKLRRSFNFCFLLFEITDYVLVASEFTLLESKPSQHHMIKEEEMRQKRRHH